MKDKRNLLRDLHYSSELAKKSINQSVVAVATNGKCLQKYD